MKWTIAFIIFVLILTPGVAATDSGDALLDAGRSALEAEDYDTAIEKLQQAVKLDADNSVYRGWLGRAYISKLQTVSFFERGVLAGRALENLQKAVELDPANVDARIWLGNYYLNAPSIAGGSKRKAREQAQAVVEYEPVAGNAMLAGIHVKDEEYELAIEKFRACIEAKPDNLEYRYRLGMLCQKLERYDDAYDVFEAALALAPDNRGALYQIGRTAAISGTNLDRGIECMRAYMELEVEPGYPGYDGAHWRLGMLYEHKGDMSSAQREYETAVRLNPDSEEFRESLQKLAGN